MNVELIDETPHPGGGLAPGKHRALAGPTRRAAIATTGEGTTGGGHETASPGPHGADLMKIRGPDVPSVGLSPEFIAHFLAESKPVPPKDTEAERIADDLAADRAALDDPAWIANASPDEVRAMREKLVADLDRRDHQELHPAGGGRFTSEHTSFGADVAADGTVTFHPGSAGLDAQDRAMLARGIDPYASAKLAWLDRTRDDRVAIGKKHEHEVLRAKLPPAGPDAYTAAELAELNAHRHSAQAFAPYPD